MRWRRTISRYLADIVGWATSGAVRKAATLHFNNFVAAIDQYGPYLAAVAVGLWMWWSGRATFRLPLTLVFLLVMSLLLLSQNSQAVGMPSAIVVLFVLYDRLRTAFSSLNNRDVAPWLLTLLLFPAVSGQRLRHEHRGLPCLRPRHARTCMSSSAPTSPVLPCQRAGAARS